MNPTERGILFIIVLVAVPFLCRAQEPHPILRSFSAVKQPNGVLLKWVIKGGKQCQGTWVYRATDGTDFEQVNHIAGICGNFTEDETYTYFDEQPVANTYNHYRLELGFQGSSDTVTVFFEAFGRNAYLLQTGPGHAYFNVLFGNDLNRTHTLEVFDLNGNRIYLDRTQGNDFHIVPLGWPGGMYILRISDNERPDITGKIYFPGL